MAETNMGVAQVSVEIPVPVGVELPLVVVLFGVALIAFVLARSDELGRRCEIYGVAGMYGGVLFGLILLAYSLTKFGFVTLLLGYDEVYLRGLPVVGLALLSVMLLLYALSGTEGTPLKVHR